MKPRIQEQIQEIEATIDRLRIAAQAAAGKVESVQAAQEELRKEHWRHRKELATLSRTVDDITGLENENARYRECVGELKDTLQNLLAGIKSLRAEYRT